MDDELKPTPTQPSLSELSRRYNIDRKTLRAYRDEHDIDLNDREAVEAHRDANANVTAATPEAKELRLEKLRAETDLKKSQAEKAALELEVTRGNLISLDEVCEAQTAIAAKVKAQLKALSVTLPPQIEGLEARDMSKRIAEAADQILTYLFEEFQIEE